MDPESINSVFAPFDCFGAILMDPVYRYQMHMRPSHGFWRTGEARSNFEGNKDNIGEQGTQENKFSILMRQGNKPIIFRGTREEVPPPPSTHIRPERASHITEAT